MAGDRAPTRISTVSYPLRGRLGVWMRDRGSALAKSAAMAPRSVSSAEALTLRVSARSTWRRVSQPRS